MSYLEMLEVAEEHWNGRSFNVKGIRNELSFNWGFAEYQVEFFVKEMKRVGII